MPSKDISPFSFGQQCTTSVRHRHDFTHHRTPRSYALQRMNPVISPLLFEGRWLGARRLPHFYVRNSKHLSTKQRTCQSTIPRAKTGGSRKMSRPRDKSNSAISRPRKLLYKNGQRFHTSSKQEGVVGRYFFSEERQLSSA